MRIKEIVNDYLNRIEILNTNIDERNEWILEDAAVGFMVESHKKEIASFERKINFYEQEIIILTQ